MTDAPKRVVAISTGIQPMDGSAGVWADKTRHGGNGTEYIRVDHALALAAEAYEDAAEAGSRMWRNQVTSERIWEALRLRTPSDALAAREARDRRVRDEALREGQQVIHDSDDVVDAIRRIDRLIEGDQTDER